MSPRNAIVGCAVVCSIVMSSGCTDIAGGDKAGARVEHVVLQMAETGYPDISNDRFAQRLLTLSHGTVRVQFLEGWGEDAANSEQQVVRSVASGRVDLGSTDARVIDTMGVDSFEALLAPMLIDNRPLQDAVLRSDLPRQMLRGLNAVGVTGLAMARGGLRSPFSERSPLLDLVDWRGIGFGTARSKIEEHTIATLGATPIEAVGPFADNAVARGQITAFASELGGYVNQGGATARVRFGTANVVLWPGFDVLLANPSRLASLTDQQRAWIQEAAAVWTTAVEAEQTGEESGLRAACAHGARFALASADDLAALQHAFVPVYDRIEKDVQTDAYIQQIRALKRTIPSEPWITIPASCRWRGSR